MVHMKHFISDLSKKTFPISDKVSGKMIHTSILKLITNDYPLFNKNCNISISELNHYREKYISNFLSNEERELSELEKIVLNSVKDQTSLASQVDGENEADLTFGQRLADKVATFGGSWTFIVAFIGFLIVWICVNAFWLANKSFDPYPFILLNLILSCVAALQAPVIMMSQNRQEEKDRERAKKDYMINLKSELEIRILHEKLDHLIMHQQQELIEVQKVQIDMMSDILRKVEQRNG